MSEGKRSRLSPTQGTEIWSRWKSGESLHEIGRAFGKPHSCIRCLLLPRGGIAPPARRRPRLALTLAEREDGVFQVPFFRPRSLHCGLEISLYPLLALLAALGPNQVELAPRSASDGFSLSCGGRRLQHQRPSGFLSRSRILTVVLAIPCTNTHFQGKASIVWDKFGTSPRQAINRGLMNHLGSVGSDTGI